MAIKVGYEPVQAAGLLAYYGGVGQRQAQREQLAAQVGMQEASLKLRERQLEAAEKARIQKEKQAKEERQEKRRWEAWKLEQAKKLEEQKWIRGQQEEELEWQQRQQELEIQKNNQLAVDAARSKQRMAGDAERDKIAGARRTAEAQKRVQQAEAEAELMRNQAGSGQGKYGNLTKEQAANAALNLILQAHNKNQRTIRLEDEYGPAIPWSTEYQERGPKVGTPVIITSKATGARYTYTAKPDGTIDFAEDKTYIAEINAKKDARKAEEKAKDLRKKERMEKAKILFGASPQQDKMGEKGIQNFYSILRRVEHEEYLERLKPAEKPQTTAPTGTTGNLTNVPPAQHAEVLQIRDNWIAKIKEAIKRNPADPQIQVMKQQMKEELRRRGVVIQ